MNILITGATGFIGQHLVNKFLQEKHNIYCTFLKNENNPFENNVVALYFWEQNHNEIIIFLETNKIDGIIHLASVFLSSHKSEDINNLIDSNVKFGTILLDLAVRSGIKWFINTGSFWQHYQNSPYSPVNLYAATKKAFESIAQYYIDTNVINFVTIKLSDTYGPNDTRLKIFNLWNKISQSGETLDMSPGNQLIDISFVDDIIDAYYLLANLMTQKTGFSNNGMAYAVKAENRYTLKQLANIFQKTTKTHLNINWGVKPYRVREVMLPWENGEAIPGWKPKITLENGIKITFAKKEND